MAVLRSNQQIGVITAPAYGLPIRIQLVFGIALEEVRTGVAVNDDALILNQYRADGIARNRVATGAEMDAAGLVAVDFYRAEFDLSAQMLSGQPRKVHRHGHRQGMPHADIVQHIFKTGLLFSQIVQIGFFEFLRQQNIARQQAGQGFLQQAFSQFHRIVPVHVFDVASNCAACAAGDGKTQPGGIRPCLFGGNDFHRIAGFQRCAKRNQAVIDPGGHGAVADVGMHRIGKIDGGRAFGQYQYPAFGGKNIHFAGEEIDFDVFQELNRICRACLQIKNVLQPFVGIERCLIEFVVAGFVCPMAGHAAFRHCIHLARSYLDFYRQAVRAGQRGMQALIAVAFRNGDIVFEFSRFGLV